MFRPQNKYIKVKLGEYICPLSCSAHHNFVRDGNYCERGVGVHPRASSVWANFSIVMECTPESRRCHSVYSVLGLGRDKKPPFLLNKWELKAIHPTYITEGNILRNCTPHTVFQKTKCRYRTTVLRNLCLPYWHLTCQVMRPVVPWVRWSIFSSNRVTDTPSLRRNSELYCTISEHLLFFNLDTRAIQRQKEKRRS